MTTASVRNALGTTIVLGLAISAAVGAKALSDREQTKPAAGPAQKMDEEYTKKIVDNTPDKRILIDLVDHMPLPLDPKVPSPLKVLGYIPGENGNLTYSKDVYAYLDALDAASARVYSAGRSARPKKAATRARAPSPTKRRSRTSRSTSRSRRSSPIRARRPTRRPGSSSRPASRSTGRPAASTPARPAASRC